MLFPSTVVRNLNHDPCRPLYRWRGSMSHRRNAHFVVNAFEHSVHIDRTGCVYLDYNRIPVRRFDYFYFSGSSPARAISHHLRDLRPIWIVTLQAYCPFTIVWNQAHAMVAATLQIGEHQSGIACCNTCKTYTECIKITLRQKLTSSSVLSSRRGRTQCLSFQIPRQR